jgi:hypothetical protein
MLFYHPWNEERKSQISLLLYQHKVKYDVTYSFIKIEKRKKKYAQKQRILDYKEQLSKYLKYQTQSRSFDKICLNRIISVLERINKKINENTLEFFLFH